MALEEKVPHVHDADAVDVCVVGTLPHDHDLLVVVPYRLQRRNLASLVLLANISSVACT